jgi:hypothetical protein
MQLEDETEEDSDPSTLRAAAEVAELNNTMKIAQSPNTTNQD